MSQSRAFKIGAATYNAAQAPADQQKRLLLLVGGLISINAASSETVNLDNSFVVGALMRVPESIFDEIAGIVLQRVTIAGGNIPVSVKDFQGSVLQYFQLIAELIRWNLEDFFGWLVSEKPAGEQASE